MRRATLVEQKIKNSDKMPAFSVIRWHKKRGVLAKSLTG